MFLPRVQVFPLSLSHSYFGIRARLFSLSQLLFPSCILRMRTVGKMFEACAATNDATGWTWDLLVVRVLSHLLSFDEPLFTSWPRIFTYTRWLKDPGGRTWELQFATECKQCSKDHIIWLLIGQSQALLTGPWTWNSVDLSNESEKNPRTNITLSGATAKMGNPWENTKALEDERKDQVCWWLWWAITLKEHRGHARMKAFLDVRRPDDEMEYGTDEIEVQKGQ